jgi:hypothetical protein
MKKGALLLFFISVSNAVISQQKIITQGYLLYNVKYIAENTLDLPPPPPPPPPSGIVMPQQETALVSFEDDGIDLNISFDPYNLKIVEVTRGRTTFLINRQNKNIIRLNEGFGFKNGTIATAEDAAAVERYMDSLYGKKKQPVIIPKIEYTDEQQVINGFTCKKALLISEIKNAGTDTATVWYFPDYKLADSFIYCANEMKYKEKLAILNSINGLPVKIEMYVTPKMKLEMELKKIDIAKNVSEKEFLVPKGFELKSLKENYGLQ